MRSHKIGRNDPCPCGRNSKYKHCCLEKVNWNLLQSQPLEKQSRHMSIRGKNITFLGHILNLIPPDKLNNKNYFVEIKRSITPEVVYQTFSLISKLWPDLEDYERAIEPERSHTTALYVGDYQPELVFRAITRLSLYSDRIFLVDPFMRPEIVNPQFNPLLHPEEHRAITLKFLYLWITLFPWIEAGIVSFIRPLDDFIPGLTHKVFDAQNQRLKNNPQLKKLLDSFAKEYANKADPFDRGLTEYMLLSLSDEEILKIYRTSSSDSVLNDEKDFLDYIQERRDNHPYYVERLPGQTAELHQESSGACYELSKQMCSLTNSHIVTDLQVRWKEIELDRENSGIDIGGWSPFAKALQSADFKALDNVPMQAALRLRKEERLESMRHFFRRVWRECADPDKFSDTNATDLAAQLQEEVAIANEEWSKIDRELLRWSGGAASTLVTSGTIGFVPAAIAAAITGTTGLINSRIQRTTFKERFPAGFFLSTTR